MFKKLINISKQDASKNFSLKGGQANTMLNQGELEECDSLPEDVLYIVRMDLKDGNVTQKVRILLTQT